MEVARDLGVDATVATRRRVATARVRFAKGLARAGVIKSLLKSSSKAARLINTGAKPQLTWGRQGKGMVPTTVRRLKAALGVCSGIRRFGGCTTTDLQLGGLQADPAYFIKAELFRTWLEVLRQLLDMKCHPQGLG